MIVALSIVIAAGGISDQAALTADETAGEESDFVWLDDLDQARLLARDRNQPLLIVFRCEP